MSRFSPIALYARERFPVRVYLPLSLFLASGLMAIETENRTWWSFVEVLPLFLLLLFPFRLLDDLSSIEGDRSRRPERVLCRTEDLRLFRMALYAAFVAAFCLLAWFSGPRKGIGYAILFWGLHLWYLLAPGISSRLARGLVPLVKYPILVLLVLSGPIRAERAWVSMALVLAAFVVYELLHDPSYGGEHPWVGGAMVRRGRIFRFLPFVLAMVWFGIGMFH